jgi:hypothetical protein
MTWIKCSDSLPDREGYILVKINGELFLGKAIGIGLFEEQKKINDIIFWLPISVLNNLGNWYLPRYYREPDEWMYVP